MSKSAPVQLKGILFDFDGTLVDTKTFYFGLIADFLGTDKSKTISLAGTIIESQLVPEDTNVRWKIIKASYQVSRRLGFSMIRSLLAMWYLSRNHSKKFSSAKPTEGAIQGLMKLKELGIQVGIISYTSRKKIRLFLSNYLQDSHLFPDENILAKGDFGKSKEEGIKKFLKSLDLMQNKRMCAIVGDLGGDIISGKNLDITTIGVTTGYAPAEILKLTNPSRIYQTIFELAEAVVVPPK
ncbi:MAG: HAD family hydrolase [Candidatus Hodarchaeales archaeon]|jgi:phosphoglycolate phosphatase-like HAD superfamily hydrolase